MHQALPEPNQCENEVRHMISDGKMGRAIDQQTLLATITSRV